MFVKLLFCALLLFPKIVQSSDSIFSNVSSSGVNTIADPHRCPGRIDSNIICC
ncbi:hypothetical protein PR003_g10297 [Phytophthora rubi]|uniref:RxLR effector protein n=1 Tax=Phytophthora rubi TaxID=129364 RepID=A0A6A4FDZ2_9STRA|nr:hypothetical protein PR003_g10297 [Phytophthora rubi]